jgi:hypothetical protein
MFLRNTGLSPNYTALRADSRQDGYVSRNEIGLYISLIFEIFMWNIFVDEYILTNARNVTYDYNNVKSILFGFAKIYVILYLQ